MTDQQRFDSLRCYGNPYVHTPHLDALAAGGALFEACYVQSPICSPSRATFATGLYPHAHGLWGNGATLPAGLPLLSKALATSGYDCGMAGKQHFAPCANGDEPRLDDGYRVYRWSHDPIHASPHNSYHTWLAREHPDIYRSAVLEKPLDTAEAGNVCKGAMPLDTVPVEAHYSHWIAEEAIAFIGDASRPADTPFYFMANFFDPHHPFGAPERFRSLYDAANLPLPSGSREELAGKPAPQREYNAKSYGGHAPGFAEYSEEELREARASYYAMVSLLDFEVGRIVEALRQRGELDDTLIVFTSDHGELLGDHAIMLKGPMLYEPSVRVPLIVHRPGAIPAGRRVGDIVQTIDLTSTILTAAGIPGAFPTQGRDLAPLACGTERHPRDWALCEYRDSGHSAEPPVHTTMLRQGRFKLVIWHGRPASGRARDGELYDLDADPGELVNLYHDPAHLQSRERMKDLLLDVLVATEWPKPPRTAAW
jgi:arylsulfatase A-like enzyme